MTTGLLWVTHAKDFCWFDISAKSYSKFASGWDHVRCIVPLEDRDLFLPACEKNNISLVPLEQWKDKGFNWHQLQQCYADRLFPECEVIFHIDADSVFGMPCTPDDWLPNGKILLPYTDYVHFLKRPVDPGEMQSFMGVTGPKIDFQRGQYNWKFAVDFALCWPAERECMPWMPIAHHRDVYAKTRQIIDANFPNLGFDGYVFQARNTHPQTFCEFNTLGAVAHKHFPEKYEWYNLFERPYPFYGKVIQNWSIGGFDRQHDYGVQVSDKNIDTPRKLFKHLGLFS